MENPNAYVGKTFGGRYHIIGIVGYGGMSVVYGAYDLKSGETCALKMFDDSNCEDDEAKAEAKRRFLNEIEVMSRLSHENIVNFKDRSGDGEPLYFVMEYIEANNLKLRINECGALSPEEILDYVVQILRALIHTHKNGIVHCDIKPHNIMLLPGGRIKLTDFGIARFVDSKENAESDTAVGTAYYISPEQAAGRKIDQRSDIYSLGVMMYEMATGRVPFVATDTSTVSQMHIDKKPTPPSIFNEKLPRGLEQIILHAMEKISFMRFQSAEDMLNDVLSLQNNMNRVFEYKPSESNTEGIGDPTPPGAKWWVYALLGVAAAFILSLIVTIVAVIVISVGKNNAKIPVNHERGGTIWTEASDE